jgi:glycosyltransferase involved in cell wall biosynthesis
MRVLLQSRKTLFTVPGGDTIQVLKSAEYLRLAGALVDVSTDLEPNVEQYDLVHLFNLTRTQETLAQAKHARRHGKPILLSPIYVDYSEYETNARTGVAGVIARSVSPSTREYLKIAARSVLNGELNSGSLRVLVFGLRSSQRELIRMTSWLLPNSESEMQRVKRDFPEALQHNYTVIPNAVDIRLFREAGDPAVPHRDGVLCVARVEGRKGQLNLVRALKSTGLKLTLIGNPAPNHLSYFNKVVEEMGPNCEYIGEVPHEQLPQYYGACKVHALVSWMETTGLSSLEAAAMGANIVITDKGDTRDYFGDDAFYCDPSSVESIRQAILTAHEAPLDEKLRRRIFQEYTWQHAAAATLKAYDRTLSLAPPRT